MTLILEFWSLVSKMMFSGFKSRWMMLCLCKYKTAERICSMTLQANSSVNVVLSIIRSKSSPPSRYSVTMKKYLSF